MFRQSGFVVKINALRERVNQMGNHLNYHDGDTCHHQARYYADYLPHHDLGQNAFGNFLAGHPDFYHAHS